MRIRTLLVGGLATLMAAVPALSGPLHEMPLQRSDIASPVVLVATSAPKDAMYAQTVLLAIPRGDGGHFGFVLNRPTQARLAQLFPDEPAAQRTAASVHVGGPDWSNSIFALVRGEPVAIDVGAAQVLPRLQLAVSLDAVDHVIEVRSSDAKFFIGAVNWKRAELANEIAQGAWQVVEANADLVMKPDTSDLWSRLESSGVCLPAPRERRSVRTAGRPVIA